MLRKFGVQEQLGARSAEGRRLRRRVLRGTVLVCIVAGYHGKRFIYERAKELGVRCCCTSPAKACFPTWQQVPLLLALCIYLWTMWFLLFRSEVRTLLASECGRFAGLSSSMPQTAGPGVSQTSRLSPSSSP